MSETAGILTSLFEKRFHPSNTPPDDWYQGVGADTATGIEVTPDNALQANTVFACVRVLAESVASLPFILYERDGKGKKRATDKGLYQVLHDIANPRMTSFEYREFSMACLLLRGNAVSEVEWGGNGEIVSLTPINPKFIYDIRLVQGKLYYYILMPGAFENQILSEDRVLHIPGFSAKGYWGLSMIQEARQSIGLALATEEFGARFFGNGAAPGGVLEHPGQLNDEAYKRMKKGWNEAHQGLSKSHRIAILEEGTQYKQVGIAPEDAQFLETRKYQDIQIAKIFRVPPHMVGDLEHATFSNIEQQSLDFVIHSLRPWLVRWEQRVFKDLLQPEERKKYFAEFLVDGLLRGDIVSRYQAFAVGRQNGWLSANDVREKENMNPIDGGDEYLVPLNMIPAGESGEGRAQETQPESRSWVPSETRAAKSARDRRRLMLNQVKVYRDLFSRMLKRQSKQIVNGAKKSLGQRSFSDFWNWLDDYLMDTQPDMVEEMSAAAELYAAEIASAAAEEVELAEVDKDWLNRFILRYLRAFASREAEQVRSKIEKVLADAQESGTDPVEALETDFQEWNEERVDSLASDEAVRTNGAVSVQTYLMAGIGLLVWRTYGTSCPYCNSLNGRVVGVNEWFLKAGEEFQPEGAETPIKPNRNVKHPPAHGGCDCLISAGG